MGKDRDAYTKDAEDAWRAANSGCPARAHLLFGKLRERLHHATLRYMGRQHGFDVPDNAYAVVVESADHGDSGGGVGVGDLTLGPGGDG